MKKKLDIEKEIEKRERIINKLKKQGITPRQKTTFGKVYRLMEEEITALKIQK